MSATGMMTATTNRLPPAREALKATLSELNALRPRHEREWLKDLLGKAMYPDQETWPVSIATARGLASRGCTKLQEADASLVVFRDRVAVIQDQEAGSLVYLFSEASEDDPSIPAPEILARSDMTWVDARTVADRRAQAGDAGDPDGTILRQRLADLLVAATTMDVAGIYVGRSPSPGEAAFVALIPPLPAEEHEFIERVAAHAALCASRHTSSAWVWELEDGAPTAHLSAFWSETPRSDEVLRPDEPASATLRALWRPGAVRRTLGWLEATGAPGDLVERARGLDAPRGALERRCGQPGPKAAA